MILYTASHNPLSAHLHCYGFNELMNAHQVLCAYIHVAHMVYQVSVILEKRVSHKSAFYQSVSLRSRFHVYPAPKGALDELRRMAERAEGL